MLMISVIVCTYNRAGALREMLESFFRQEACARIEHELIIVDNNSTDETRAIIEEWARRWPSLRYTREKRQGLSPARNRGLEEARGDWVAYLDDDVLLDSTWLEALQRCIQETSADVVCGRIYLAFKTPPPAWLGAFLRPYFGELDLGPSRLRLTSGEYARGGNLAMRKAWIRDLGGFNEALGRTGAQLLADEETRLAGRIARAGGVLIYEPAMVVGHVVGPDRMTWEYFNRVYAGLGATVARREPWRGRAWQAARLIHSLIHYALCAARSEIKHATCSRDAYQLARCQWTRSAHLLQERRRIQKEGGLPDESTTSRSTMSHLTTARSATAPLPSSGNAPTASAPPIVFLRDRFRHMGRRSGYDLLYEAMAPQWAGPAQGLVRDLTNAVTNASDLLFSPLLTRVMGSPYYSLSSLRMEWRVLQEARRTSPLLAHVMYLENDWGLLQCRRASCPGLRVIATAHQPPEWWQRQKRLLKRLPALDALITLSSLQTDFFRSICSARIFQIPHGVDVDFFRPAPEEQEAPKTQSPFRCVFAGSHLRDFETLARIIEWTLASEPSIQFDLLVSFRDRYHPALRRLTQYEQITWRSAVSDEALRDIYQQAGALVLPLTGATANNSILEAMACGLPIITTDLPATRDYCDASFAALVPPGDVAGAVETIFMLAGDPQERRNRAAAARAHAESHFAWPLIAARMAPIYRETLSAF